MSCNEDFKVLLSRYVDGELSPEERQKVDDHLLSCEPCRELLALFQKNENLLAGALSTDAFGDAVIESVVRKIGRQGPVEAKPVDEGLLDWFRARPWVSIGAAAVLLLGLLAALQISHSNQMSELRAMVKRAGASSSVAQEDNRKLAVALQDEEERSNSLAMRLKQLQEDRDIRDATQNARPGSIFGYVEVDHFLKVRATFDSKNFSGYNVLRREESEKDDRYVVLNAKPLDAPEYTDRGAKQGHGYVYKFQALRSNGESVESAPVMMKLPFAGDLAPEKSVRIHCEELGAQKDIGAFRLERLINGRAVSQRFYVKVGERIGKVADVPGVGEIDFTTDLALARIEEGTEELKIWMTQPVLDSEGRPLTSKVVDGKFVPVTESINPTLGTRPNRKAYLKPVGSADPKMAEPLWKDSWMRVRAHAE